MTFVYCGPTIRLHYYRDVVVYVVLVTHIWALGYLGSGELRSFVGLWGKLGLNQVKPGMEFIRAEFIVPTL